jgi:hypothetical protein
MQQESEGCLRAVLHREMERVQLVDVPGKGILHFSQDIFYTRRFPMIGKYTNIIGAEKQTVVGKFLL